MALPLTLASGEKRSSHPPAVEAWLYRLDRFQRSPDGARAISQEWIWIDCAEPVGRGIDSEVQMRRRVSGVSRLADVTDDVPRRDGVTRLEPRAKRIEVRVVVELRAVARDVDDVAAQAVLPDAHHLPRRRRHHRRAARREDVDAFVVPPL